MRTRFTPGYTLLVGWLALLAWLPALGQTTINEGNVADSTEIRVLRQLYFHTQGDDWLYRDNWPASTTPTTVTLSGVTTTLTMADVATWQGVSVSQGDVVGLRLLDRNLRGRLPASLGLLTQLQRLDLSQNPELTGPIPASLGDTQLTTLNLSSCALTETIPASLGTLPLVSLALGHNRLTGTIPTKLTQLANLQQLDLRYNALTGSLPAALGDLRNLTSCILEYNRLSGEIPGSIVTCTSLTQLNLAHNLFSGSVPPSLATLPELAIVDLRQNGFTWLPSWAGKGYAPSVLLVGGNYLDFSSIAPNFPEVGQPVAAQFNFDYMYTLPGDTLPTVAGAYATLSGHMRGTGNHYTWERLVGQAWVTIEGQTGTQLALPSVSADMAGFYRQRVVNDKVVVNGVQPVLYTPFVYLDVRPYAPLPLNEPQDAGCPAVVTVVPDANPAVVTDLNYVRTYTAREAYTDPDLLRQASVQDVQVQTQYLDGLGRPVQTVLRQESPLLRDVVQPMAYDALGRQPREYLPYTATTSTDGFRPDAVSEQYGFYAGTASGLPLSSADVAATQTLPKTGFPYAEKAFEPSPLGRVLAQGASGEAWALGAVANHAAVFVQRPNKMRDAVARWEPGYDTEREDLITRPGYAAGELWVALTQDEQKHLSRTFTDRQGHVVLKQVAERIAADTTWLSTYYVYDDFDRLRAVLPPLAVQRIRRNNGTVTGAGVEQLLFRYHYDDQGRLIEKQVPDTEGYTYFIYDELDRPILTQDAVQRERSEWVATKYDALGRVAYTALVSRPGKSRAQLQALAVEATAQWEAPSTILVLGQVRYTNDAFPVLGSGDELLSITYYDSYDYTRDGVADATYDAPTTQQLGGPAPTADLRVQGLATRTLVRVLGVPATDPTAWLTTTSFFDEKLRPIQVVSTNARGGTDVASSRYDFAGKVLGYYATHMGLNHPTVRVQQTPSYDHVGRVLSTTQRLNDGPAVVLATHAYNELGQVEKKVLGNQLQTVDYRYNIRGWLTQLNDPEQAQTQDLWSLSLHYACGFADKQYGGNIAGQRWRSKSDNVERAYGYRYDSLNRVLQGDFVAKRLQDTKWEAERHNYRFWGASYDANGNLLTLRRRGLLQEATRTTPRQYGVTDNLRYRYTLVTENGGLTNSEASSELGLLPLNNRLLRVDDLVASAAPTAPGQPARADFQDGITAGSTQQDYFYDAAGSMVADRNKGIVSIEYNYLHLPERITWQNGNTLQYIYSAAGQKVAKIATEAPKPGEQAKPAVRTDYLGAWQYERDSLQWLSTSEGRALYRPTWDAAGGVSYGFEQEYTIKDHLGNLRVAFHEGRSSVSVATMEASQQQREEQLFDAASLQRSRVDVGTANSHGGQYVAKLNAGGNTPVPIGPLKQITVGQDDVVEVQAYAKYLTPPSNANWSFSLASFVTSLIQPQTTAMPGPDGKTQVRVLPLLSIGLGLLPAVQSLNSQVPTAYVRILVFNQDSVLLPEQCQLVRLTTAAQGYYEPLNASIKVQQAGYVQVYVANESNIDVYFDDVQVTHQQGLQVQENHYDPFGLDLVGLSKSATPENKYSWNGKEKQTEFGLNWHDHGWRFYDPVLGRWVVSDPDAEEGDQESWGTYQFGLDNAVRYNDLDGRQAGPGGPPIPDDFMVRGFFGPMMSAINLVGQGWATATGSATKVQVNFLTDDNGLAYDVAWSKVPVAGATSEAKTALLDATSVALTVLPAGRAGAGKMLEDGTKRVVAAEASLEARAVAIQNAQPNAVARNRSTTAVVSADHPDGTSVNFVGSSRNRLTPAQRAEMRPGEVEAKGAGHAEVTAMKAAKAQGYTPRGVAASRPICTNCAQAISENGAQALSPIKQPVRVPYAQ